jgi:hypothetical protein
MSNLLFCFWFAPLAMALFLGSESESGCLDTVVVLDFVQAILICVAAYLYFFYLPKSESHGELAHSVWAPYFVGYGFVASGFSAASCPCPLQRCPFGVRKAGSLAGSLGHA